MPQPEDGSKLTTEEYQGLMKDHGIYFEGRILPEQWGEYSEIFQEIRRIGEIRPDEFISRFYADDEYIVDKRVKASKLMEEAWNCFQNTDSEYGWRKEVEFRAFEPFESEVVCHICHHRRWKPKFEARPIDPTEAERLQRRRGRRRLCTCTALQRADVNMDDHCFRVFSRALDKKFDHEDVAEHLKKRLKRQRPDRVIGLEAKGTIRHYLHSSPLQTRYSPFRQHNVVYPFIVIEAKAAENAAATFGSILRQTAFVVRTCLRLQQNLQQETRGAHQCLVWSFAIMGEEWRLYAAVPKGQDVQIFDLWHGTVLFQEGALQLLLIIDYLCDWASEVYRLSVLTCLANGRANLRGSRLTPSGTDISSQVSEADVSDLRGVSLPLRSSLVPDFDNSTMIGPRSTTPEEYFWEIGVLDRNDPEPLVDLEDVHNWQRWITNEQRLPPWTQRATIRHSNQVELTSLELTLPEESRTLQIFLETSFPDHWFRDAAKKLLTAMHDDNIAVTISKELVSGQADRQNHPVSAIRALIYFRSALKPEDWQITRHLLFITSSEKAMATLAQIAGLPPTPFRYLTLGDDAEFEKFRQAVVWPELVGGTQSVTLALMRPQLCLRAVTNSVGSSNFEWVKYSPQSAEIMTAEQLRAMASHVLRVDVPNVLTPYVEKRLLQYIVPAGYDTPEALAPTLDTPRFRAPGVLVKKPRDGWPEATQEFCFLVADENVHFDDDARLGRLLQEVRTARQVYGVVRDEAYEARNDDLLIRWVQVLKRQLPQDTQL